MTSACVYTQTAAQFFRGERHYIGGRFVPPDLSLRYGIEAYSAMYKGVYGKTLPVSHCKHDGE